MRAVGARVVSVKAVGARPLGAKVVNVCWRLSLLPFWGRMFCAGQSREVLLNHFQLSNSTGAGGVSLI